MHDESPKSDNSCCTAYVTIAMERKLLTLLEEIKQQGQTMILLQQQILNARQSEGQPPRSMDGRLPATTVEELQLISSEASDKDTRSDLVCDTF